MRATIVLAGAMLAAAVTASAQKPADLTPLTFLAGDWRATDTAPGEEGRFAFQMQVQDHVMVRTNLAAYAAAGDRPASRHDDLMVIYGENGTLKADYFDNEGHVIRYVVHPERNGRVVFISEPVASQPRYRLTYALGADGVLNGSFEIAAPGSPDAFKPYLAWKAKKQK